MKVSRLINLSALFSQYKICCYNVHVGGDLLMVIGMKVYTNENPLNAAAAAVVWERDGSNIITTTALDIGFKDMSDIGKAYWQHEMENALPPVSEDQWQRRHPVLVASTSITIATAEYSGWYHNGDDRPIVHIPFATVTNNMGWHGEPLTDFDLDLGEVFFEISRRL
jgi:hypothetical protein